MTDNEMFWLQQTNFLTSELNQENLNLKPEDESIDRVIPTGVYKVFVAINAVVDSQPMCK